jgi:hypothetical protein
MPEQAVPTAPAEADLPWIEPGDRIRVTERIVGHDQTWLTDVEGEVVSVRPEPTGAWYAHARHAHLWLPRIVLRKDDGELSSLIVDPNAQVETLHRARATARST